MKAVERPRVMDHVLRIALALALGFLFVRQMGWALAGAFNVDEFENLQVMVVRHYYKMSCAE